MQIPGVDIPNFVVYQIVTKQHHTLYNGIDDTKATSSIQAFAVLVAVHFRQVVQHLTLQL